ncbi:hypothetical protein Q5P01_020967 [Channa striata]|uniref:Uncharacterized protein n=1 Tax=Channa striata TaxID=64152 RepID=A0AA88LYM0_CHASR|nr:hypothetical protein Q5P01_020967 [Channa striata]
MSAMTDKSAENPDVDRVSLNGNRITPTKDDTKETPPKANFIRAKGKLLLSFRKKTLRPRRKEAPASNDPGSPNPPVPPSPGLSPGYTSPVCSPPKNSGSSFQEKDGDETDNGPQSNKAVERSKSNLTITRFASIRKRKNKSMRITRPSVNGESSSEEKNEDEEEVKQEMEETYTLPETPHTPLSVMQINKLIETMLFEEAHVNLLAMRQEFRREQEQSSEDSSMELTKKEKDLSLLYTELRNKIMDVVSCKEVPASVVRIIQEEEKRAQEPGGIGGSWMEAWREAVVKGVQAKVDSVPLQSQEQNSSWMAVHLGQLGQAIVEDLGNVKREVRWSYPPSFKVFSTYVNSYHRVVGQHMKQVEQHVTDLRDLYQLLDWIINTYKSERIMGHESLQPDMKAGA